MSDYIRAKEVLLKYIRPNEGRLSDLELNESLNCAVGLLADWHVRGDAGRPPLVKDWLAFLDWDGSVSKLRVDDLLKEIAFDSSTWVDYSAVLGSDVPAYFKLSGRMPSVECAQSWVVMDGADRDPMDFVPDVAHWRANLRVSSFSSDGTNLKDVFLEPSLTDLELRSAELLQGLFLQFQQQIPADTAAKLNDLFDRFNARRGPRFGFPLDAHQEEQVRQETRLKEASCVADFVGVDEFPKPRQWVCIGDALACDNGAGDRLVVQFEPGYVKVERAYVLRHDGAVDEVDLFVVTEREDTPVAVSSERGA